jgi:hypothetical protein
MSLAEQEGLGESHWESSGCSKYTVSLYCNFHGGELTKRPPLRVLTSSQVKSKMGSWNRPRSSSC